MPETVLDNCRKELKVLLREMEAHPERDWSEQKKRVNVLHELIASYETARG